MNDEKFDAMFDEHGCVIVNKEALEALLKQFDFEDIVEAFDLSMVLEDLTSHNIVDLIFDLYKQAQIKARLNRLFETLLRQFEFEDLIEVFGLTDQIRDLVIPDVGLMLKIYRTEDVTIREMFNIDMDSLEDLLYTYIIDFIIDDFILEFLNIDEFDEYIDLLLD